MLSCRLDLRLSLIHCRLLLRKSSVTFAERKTTLDSIEWHWAFALRYLVFVPAS